MSAWDGTPQQLMIAIANLLADSDNTAAQAVFFEAVEAANAYRRLPTPPTSRGLLDEVATLRTSLDMTKQQLERVEVRLKACEYLQKRWCEIAAGGSLWAEGYDADTELVLSRCAEELDGALRVTK